MSLDRDRTFRFKRFGERINEIDVDVFRSTEAVRTEPAPGCSSFFEEGLGKWRELNSAEHFTGMWNDLHQLSQSLPLLLHNKGKIFGLLNGALTIEVSPPALSCRCP